MLLDIVIGRLRHVLRTRGVKSLYAHCLQMSLHREQRFQAIIHMLRRPLIYAFSCSSPKCGSLTSRSRGVNNACCDPSEQSVVILSIVGKKEYSGQGRY